MKKVSYSIKGIDCPNCANKIQIELNKKNEIQTANLDFVNERLLIEYKQKSFSNSELEEMIRKLTGEIVQITVQKSNEMKKKVITKEIMFLITRIIVASVVLLLTFLLAKDNYPLNLLLCLVAYFVVSYDVIWKFFRNFIHIKNVLDESTLMIVASVGAFCIFQFFEGTLVLLLFQVGEVFEKVSVNQSRNAILKAIDMRPKTVTVIMKNEMKTKSVEELEIGDIVLLKVDEIVPSDGKIIEGNGAFDTSSLTGESMPLFLKENDNAISGYILKSGSVKIKIIKEYKDSTTSKILDLVISSSQHKAKAESFVSKFARIYTPIVLLLALHVALITPLFTGDWIGGLRIALTFLVISCPCAIVISVPLSFFTGVGLASKNGIVIKGANYLDKINEIQTLVCDKTGTLTEGQFRIAKKVPINIKESLFDEYILACEQRSNHPLAVAIVNELKMDNMPVLQGKFNEKPGYGISMNYKRHKLLVGNDKLLYSNGISFAPPSTKLSVVYLAVDGEYKGYIALDDLIKQNALSMVEKLNKLGIKTVMLTGDREDSAKRIADKLQISSYHANLLPENKVIYLENEIATVKKNEAVAYVGDGINDSPCIIRADIGFAMGALGSDAAIDNADAVIMNDDPLKIITSIKIAKATRKRAIIDICVALFVKISVMIISCLPFAFLQENMMWIAVLADTGLSLLLIIYSIFLIKKKSDNK